MSRKWRDLVFVRPLVNPYAFHLDSFHVSCVVQYLVFVCRHLVFLTFWVALFMLFFVYLVCQWSPCFLCHSTSAACLPGSLSDNNSGGLCPESGGICIEKYMPVIKKFQLMFCFVCSTNYNIRMRLYWMLNIECRLSHPKGQGAGRGGEVVQADLKKYFLLICIYIY